VQLVGIQIYNLDIARIKNQRNEYIYIYIYLKKLITLEADVKSDGICLISKGIVTGECKYFERIRFLKMDNNYEINYL